MSAALLAQARRHALKPEQVLARLAYRSQDPSRATLEAVLRHYERAAALVREALER